MRLYLVRHAQPDVPEGTCYGRSDLPTVAEHQRHIIVQLATSLPARVPIFSSHLQRCRTLAVDLACSLDAGEPTIDQRLAEMDFGAWEMKAWSAIQREEIDAWSADLEGYRPGGGESLLDVARRVRAFHDDLRRKELPAAIVIGHAGTIRLLLAGLQSETAEAMVALAAQTANRIAYGELITVDC